ncbi:hypothetical protein EJB05_41139, partial [Eragrostis curvula]
MADFSPPPGLVFFPPPPWPALSPPPPPPLWWTRSPPPPPPWWTRSPPPPWLPLYPSFTNSSTPQRGGLIAGMSILVAAIVLFMLICICRIARGEQRDSNDEQQLGGAGEREINRRRVPRRSNTKAGLPSLTYTQSLKHNVTGSGDDEEAATCSVCLGALEVGETVRLLPACLHLYHVECIDPWLDAHTTCPDRGYGHQPEEEETFSVVQFFKDTNLKVVQAKA